MHLVECHLKCFHVAFDDFRLGCKFMCIGASHFIHERFTVHDAADIDNGRKHRGVREITSERRNGNGSCINDINTALITAKKRNDVFLVLFGSLYLPIDIPVLVKALMGAVLIGVVETLNNKMRLFKVRIFLSAAVLLLAVAVIAQ